MDFPLRSQPNLAPADLAQFDILHTGHHYPLGQQVYGPHGINGAVAFTPQAQIPGGHFATTQNHAPHPFSQSTSLPSHEPHDAEFASIGQSAYAAPTGPASPMGPPARPRKRKAPTIHADDWEPYKHRILDLHLTQGLPLSEVRQRIEDEYGFKANERQYRTRISQWRKDKNVKPQEMQAIVRKRQRRKLVETNKAELVFEVRGSFVPPQKIERWMKRNDVVESFLYAPSPAASTPSVVGCHTISERGSPAMIFSPGVVYHAAQSPQMPSPALSSVSSVVRLQESVFAGQSPALAYRSLVGPQLSSDLTQSTTEMDVNARSRYKGDEQERLRAQIYQAETSFSSSAQETSDMLYRLGSVLLDQGRYKAAEDVARRLVESHKGESGDSNNSTGMLEALFLLGRVLDHRGLYIMAEKLHWRVSKAREKVLGPEHPDTLTNMSNLALVLDNQGKYEEAEAMNRQELECTKKVLGHKHPDTLKSVYCLAHLLASRHHYKESLALYERACIAYRTVLGIDHPTTCACRQHYNEAQAQSNVSI